MIVNGSALNVCPVTTLKQMNLDLNRVRSSKIAVQAFDGSRMEVNGEIDLLIDVGPCSFSIMFQVLDIPNAFSLLLGRPLFHSAGAVPSSLHQRLKFIVEEKLITVKGEDYAIYKETAVPYISVGDDENLPFHSFEGVIYPSFETISVIRENGEVGPSRADRMIGKGINRPIEVEEYKNRRGLGFRPSCHEIIEARRGNHLCCLAAYYGKLNRGILVPSLSRFFPGPPHIIGSTLDGPSSDSDDALAALPAVYAVTEEIPSGVHIRLAQEDEELDNWTSVSRYSAMIADVVLNFLRRFFQISKLHSNPNLRHINSSPFEERLGELRLVYFGEGLTEDGQVPEIEQSLRRLGDRQLTSVEPTEEINLRRQRDSLLLRIKEEVVKQINARFLEVCNYSEWVANIVAVEKKDGRVRVRVDYRDLNKANPKDNFPLPHIDVLVDNTARHA
ncbi:hypothetical protein CRG98_006381 [Punica granatum]|uniref:G-patch domain-containing protein n=1 Tax=Punica granatum TaxID=22663 RepID=A0A2I0KZE8_PUNGR|nr:hypothetical protein CRG98_006381 [Punica granatum]